MPVNAVIVSDVHYDASRLRRLLPIINASDYFVFCGDGMRDVSTVVGEINTRVVCVRGNCDLGSMVSVSSNIALGKACAFVTHGHAYGVKQSLLDLAEAAKSKGCDIAFFGHTHKFTDTVIDGVRLINPGALCNGSYAFVTVDGNNISCEQKSI